MANILMLLSFLLMNFHQCLAQTGSAISPGSSITAGSTHSWVSPLGDFAFGFYHLSNDLYLAGIWFDKIPEKILVWSANRDNPAPLDSVVQLNNTGHFEILSPTGSIIPSTFTEQKTPASSGQMQDDGNLVLKNANPEAVWQSFDWPTDTLLPGQVLGVDKKMFSARTNSDFSTGNFMLQMQSDGNLVLSNYLFSNIGYWFTIATEVPNTVLMFDNSASMFLTNGTSPIGQIFRNLTVNDQAPIKDYYHRATIGVHGDFRQYIHHKTDRNEWKKIWGAMSDPCLVNTVCGLNGLCISSDNDTVTCDCLPGFVHLDPTDAMKGCRPKTVDNYHSEDYGKTFEIQVINDVDIDFPPGAGQFSVLATTNDVDVEGCKQAILGDRYAMAATLNGRTCLSKRTPLMNARNTSNTKGLRTLIKVPSGNSLMGLNNKPKANRNTESSWRSAI